MTYQLMQPLGAAATEWSWSQYENLAIATAQGAVGNYLVVSVGRNGSSASAKAYPSRALALTAFDALRASMPASLGFAIAYDKTQGAGGDGVIEQAVNPILESIVTRRLDWRTMTPWIAGGAVLIAAAIAFTRRKKAPARRAPRRRSLPRWRKRVVTVWR